MPAPAVYRAHVVAIDLDTATNASLWTIVVVVLVALAAVWLVKQVVTKFLTVAVLLALAFIVWSQRTELVDCADSVRTMLRRGRLRRHHVHVLQSGRHDPRS